ncbi:tetratricopeptide repeat protein [Actinomycetaceae bacterium TAE3-ERU4]|nr:tetratricopeptide repeat protein [Actinomycetaceae bacterium TAE3-ERU4]
MAELDDLDDLMVRADSLPWGKTSSSLWAQAAKLAEERGDIPKALRAYISLCDSYAMGGQITRSIAPFIWVDNLYRTRPELFGEDELKSLSWIYKYIARISSILPSISYEQSLNIFAQMRSFYLANGFSLRDYHIRRYRFWLQMGETEKAEESYQKWYSVSRSEVSDCVQCDSSNEVKYALAQEKWEEAAAAGDRALTLEGQNCSLQPEQLLGILMEPWLRVGRDREAWAAHKRAYRYCQQSPLYLEFLHLHLRYLALSGAAGRRERLERGLRILIRHLPWWKEAEDPTILLNLSSASYLLLSAFSKEDENRVIPAVLPGEDLPWKACENLTNPTLGQAREWFEDFATKLGNFFASRPGLPHREAAEKHFQKLMHPQPVPPLEPEGPLSDVSGIDSIFIPSFKVFTQEPQEIQEHSSVNQDSLTESQEEEDTPPRIPISLHGDWDEMNLKQLLRRSLDFGKDVYSIYRLKADQLMLMDESLLKDSVGEELPEDLRSTWEESRKYISRLGNFNDENEIIVAQSSDPAYSLIAKSRAAYKEKDYFTAAQLADEATRTQGGEPLGVLISALQTLMFSAYQAGYMNEALDAGRERLNLFAALNLKYLQAATASIVAQLLLRQRRPLEAAEAAQNGLDILEGIEKAPVIKMRLLEVFSKASKELGQAEVAADHLRASAKILEEYGQIEKAIDSLRTTGKLYLEEHNFLRSIEAHLHSVALSRQEMTRHIENLYQTNLLESDEEKIEKTKAEYKKALEARISCLFEASYVIVHQPGRIEPADIAQMEDLMQELLDEVSDQLNDPYLPGGCEWQKADWLSDMASMKWNCFEQESAINYQMEAIESFQRLEDTIAQARCLFLLGQMYRIQEKISKAKEVLEQSVALLQDPKYAGNTIRADALQLLRELEETGEN